MKKRFLIFIIINFTCLGTDLTFKLNGGRLGDNLTNCLKCLEVAHEFTELNFIPEPFKYYEYFSFEPSKRNYYKTINIKHKDQIKRYLEQQVTLVTDYYFKTDLLEAIKDPTYKKMIQKIFMVNPSIAIEIPDSYHSVAIHIRKGSLGDPPLLSDQLILPKRQYSDRNYPLKFPPNQYYIDQLRYLITSLPNKKFFVYIFTDHKNPLHLKELFEQCFAQTENIIFSCRKNDISYGHMIIDDFLNMMRFDYLIRSDSNYSRTAHLIGEHKVIIYPISYRWKNNLLFIDKVKVVNAVQNTEEIRIIT